MLVKRKAVAVLAIVCMILTACGSHNHPEAAFTSAADLTETGKSADSAWPSHLDQNISSHFSINADLSYPSECKAGISETATMGDKNLWDRRDEMMSALIPPDQQTARSTENDGSWENKSDYCESKDGKDLFNIDGLGGLTYEKDKDAVQHIENAIDTDPVSSSYNGDVYMSHGDLDFKTKQEAWDEAKKFLSRLGIDQISDHYQCFPMDYQTMGQEEKKLNAINEAAIGKHYDTKTDWTQKDNCYYFLTYQEWNGEKVVPAYEGEGTDTYSIWIIVNAEGVEGLSVNSYYPVKSDGSKIDIKSPSELLSSLKNYFENIITDDTYEVNHIWLGQKMIMQGDDPHTWTLTPVWNVKMKITPAPMGTDSAESGMDSIAQAPYASYVSFDASTLKVINS